MFYQQICLADLKMLIILIPFSLGNPVSSWEGCAIGSPCREKNCGGLCVIYNIHTFLKCETIENIQSPLFLSKGQAAGVCQPLCLMSSFVGDAWLL